MTNNIFLGTILLEKNRWTTRIPSYKVSEWYERFINDGFDSIELWENHIMKTDADERIALAKLAAPVAIFNTYDEFTDDTADYRKEIASVIEQINAKAVKFNFGNDYSKMDEYVRNLIDWVKLLPDDCRLLCECHPDTVLEVPETAAGVFKRLADERYQAIVHVFEAPEAIKPWFEALGSRITHAHVRMMDENNKRVRLQACPDKVKSGLQAMFDEGFKGTFTIEFTEGVRTPGENIDELYSCALDDLAFLRGCLK